jgi:hypothetical protein
MQAAAVSEARQEIAILRACRDVNIVQFQVRGGLGLCLAGRTSN